MNTFSTSLVCLTFAGLCSREQDVGWGVALFEGCSDWNNRGLWACFSACGGLCFKVWDQWSSIELLCMSRLIDLHSAHVWLSGCGKISITLPFIPGGAVAGSGHSLIKLFGFISTLPTSVCSIFIVSRQESLIGIWVSSRLLNRISVTFKRKILLCKRLVNKLGTFLTYWSGIYFNSLLFCNHFLFIAHMQHLC